MIVYWYMVLIHPLDLLLHIIECMVLLKLLLLVRYMLHEQCFKLLL
jgi:hypothetical protein